VRRQVRFDMRLQGRFELGTGLDARLEHDEGFWFDQTVFVGDAVLELIAAEHLYHTYATSDEGELTRLRASVVNTKSLARLASRLSLGDYLLLGKGAHKTGARSLQSILANTFEAVIGAIFLDQGYRAAYRLFSRSLIDVQAWPAVGGYCVLSSWWKESSPRFHRSRSANFF